MERLLNGDVRDVKVCGRKGYIHVKGMHIVRHVRNVRMRLGVVYTMTALYAQSTIILDIHGLLIVRSMPIRKW